MNSSSAKPTITNSISNVLGSTATKPASSVIGSTSSTTTTSYGSFFSNMSWTTILLLVLFFFFFGFGIFVYLAKGTESAVDFIINLFTTLLQKIMHFFGNDSVDF